MTQVSRENLAIKIPSLFNFEKHKTSLPMPDLLEIQKQSYEVFLQTGLEEIFQEIFPIKDAQNYHLEYKGFEMEPPKLTIQECKDKGFNFSGVLKIKTQLLLKQTGEVKEGVVVIGELPRMTSTGSFIINGTERVVVSQLIRSPGVYYSRVKEKLTGFRGYSCTVIPDRGTWLEFEYEESGQIAVKIDKRSKKIPVTLLLKALGFPSNDQLVSVLREPQEISVPAHSDSIEMLLGRPLANAIADLATGEVLAEKGQSLSKALLQKVKKATVDTIDLVEEVLDPDLRLTLEKDPSSTQEEAQLELYKRLHPGEPPTKESARALVRNLFLDPKRNDLGLVGRYKFNKKLYLEDSSAKPTLETRTITKEDVLQIVRYFLRLKRKQAVVDDIDHLGNRRVRTVGELLQNQLRMGFVRMERNIRDRMTTVDPAEADPKALINPRPVVAAIREFFGSSQLSQFMDETNPLAALTHKRRLSSLGPGGLNRERAGVEVRDIHHSHYGRVCPIETPEGPNIGLINSLTTYSRVNEFGFITTPYRKIIDGKVTDEIVYLTADEEEKDEQRPAGYRIAEANSLDEKGNWIEPEILVRHGEKFETVPANQVDLVDICPRQVFSISASLIPFLEHDDPIRALMGCNMQRQAVPLLKPDLAIVGTGLERAVAVDSGEVTLAGSDGEVISCYSNLVVIKTKKGLEKYTLLKFGRSNRATCINQRPIVRKGDKVKKGQPIADGAATVRGELALGSNVLVAFLPWAGYNYEDAMVISERLVRDDVYTSIHIEEYQVEARDTKLGPEEITREIPNVSEEMLRNLDETGTVRIGAEVRAGDILGGKVTPKGETELSPEERLLRAIFGEKAREVRDTSLRVPHGEKGTVIDVKVFSKENGDELQAGVLKKIKVYVAQKRKVMEGDKMSGRHGNKGVISIIVPEADMPFLPDGTPLDIVLNPLGVPSRMNVGQILELHLGYAGRALGLRFETPVFSGAGEPQVKAYLKKANLPMNGKTILYDGRTGEPFDNPVAVGVMYMMKLIHLVEDKIHARSIGPYSLVTQQPLGGKAQFGGQRFGEMEVWALEAYGAASVLQEMLTVKSDDITGRVKTYEAIVKGKDMLSYSLPESFKVLVKEMQGLGLDVKLISEQEGEIALKESEEDIRHKADELDLIFKVQPEEVSETIED
ncbi:MAG: DNA-directed RNA polymerase subunit beta [bacterium]